jgi:hypothetical protein
VILNSPGDVCNFIAVYNSSFRNFTLVINYDLKGSYDSPFYSLTEEMESIDFTIVIGPDCHSIDYLFYWCANLISVPEFDTGHVCSMNYAFAYCAGLTEVPLLDTSRVENMAGLFAGCSSLTEVPAFNTSMVLDMSYLFEGCTNLRIVPHMDTSSLLFANYTFHGCTALECIPDMFLENVITAEGMFKECRNLHSLPKFKMSNVCYIKDFVVDTSITEDNAPVLTVCSARIDREDGVKIEYVKRNVPEDGVVVLNSILDLTDEIQIAIIEGKLKEVVINYDVVCKRIGNTWYSNSPFVGTYYELEFRKQHRNNADVFFPFGQRHVFLHVDFAITFGQRCHSAAGLFLNCSELKSVKWFDTNQITDMHHMFLGCKSLKFVPSLDLQRCRNLSGFFAECSSLVSVPMFNTADAVDLSEMYVNCQSIENTGEIDLSSARNITRMFAGCRTLDMVNLCNSSEVRNLSGLFLALFWKSVDAEK